MNEIINLIHTMQNDIKDIRTWKEQQERINECEEAVEAENVAEFNAYIEAKKAEEQNNLEAAKTIKSMLI